MAADSRRYSIGLDSGTEDYAENQFTAMKELMVIREEVAVCPSC